MANPSWKISGEFAETCSCDYLCPCLPTNMQGKATKDYCNFVLVFRIDDGNYGDVKLNGLHFAVVAHTPQVMAEGNWAVGVIVDNRANSKQKEAIVSIASGKAGGPMGAAVPLIGKMLGVEDKPIRFEMDGLKRRVSIPGALEMEIEGVKNPHDERLMYLDNVGHPVNSRLALARANRSTLDAFGYKLENTGGRTNGHFTPFAWRA